MKFTRWRLQRRSDLGAEALRLLQRRFAPGVDTRGNRTGVRSTPTAPATSHCHLNVVGLAAAILLFACAASAQTDVTLKPLGGGGGGQFVARCQPGQLLTGLDLLTGDDVDAIQPLCVKASGPTEVGPITPGARWFGGNGGPKLVRIACPKETPIVIGMSVRAQGVATLIVNGISLQCGRADAIQPEYPGSAKFEEPDKNYDYTHPGRSFLGLAIFNPRADKVPEIRGSETCFNNGMVAVGINGRSGIWLDAVGLICGEPKLTTKPPEPVKAVGRTRTETAPGPPRAICDLAREARARNSPAAAGLEAQCRAAGAAGEIPPVKAVGRVSSPKDVPSDTPPRPICDLAREARERNSPAATGLEEKCRDDLAEKGLAIAQVDEIVAALRAAEMDEKYAQGFDIASGIFGDPALGALGNTQLGPWSLRIRDSLSPAGQRGFNISVKLHLSRHYKH